MANFTWIEGEYYVLKSDHIGGLVLTRRRDQASCYFQPGDDANQVRGELGDENGEFWRHGRPIGFDDWASSYEDLIQGHQDQGGGLANG